MSYLYKRTNTVKLCYNRLGYNGHLVNTDFFIFPAESVLISLSDNMVRMDSISTDFDLLQTTFQVPTVQTRWIQQTN